ncbi:MAG TPA: DUF4384 domain-containing protein [Stellaceae bacterium]|nr:DUF4384 domain-containing protein [Stellaceae bacterium]
MPRTAPGRRLLIAAVLAAGIAAGTTACTVAHRTEVFRQDELSDAQQAIADIQFAAADLTIDGTVDRADTTYNPNQPITLSVRTSKDANVAILRVLANGDTTIVFPNRAHRDAALRANTTLTVPAGGDKVKIAADKPGVVLFALIASASDKSWLFKRPPDDGSDFADLGVTSRNIAKDIASSLKGSAAAAVHLTVRISGGGLL